jgi:hypothetical protein
MLQAAVWRIAFFPRKDHNQVLMKKERRFGHHCRARRRRRHKQSRIYLFKTQTIQFGVRKCSKVVYTIKELSDAQIKFQQYLHVSVTFSGIIAS